MQTSYISHSGGLWCHWLPYTRPYLTSRKDVGPDLSLSLLGLTVEQLQILISLKRDSFHWILIER